MTWERLCECGRGIRVEIVELDQRDVVGETVKKPRSVF